MKPGGAGLLAPAGSALLAALLFAFVSGALLAIKPTWGRISIRVLEAGSPQPVS
ncbi:MAG: hypothetical protein JWO82_570 [Akkermansiaceae bacterium]|nr:hypothetical protein [Akkermansiaceae bacterium]